MKSCKTLPVHFRFIPNLFQRTVSIIFGKMDKKISHENVKSIRSLLISINELFRTTTILSEDMYLIEDQITELSQTQPFRKILEGIYLSDTIKKKKNLTLEKIVKEDDEDNEPPRKKGKFDFTEKEGHTVIFTDGACTNNGRSNSKAGIGVWFGKDHPLNMGEPVKGNKATNNVAEIQACIRALEIARNHSIKNVMIVTDSEFTINCMTNWIHKWKQKNWQLSKGGDVKNKDDLVILDGLLKQFTSVKWEHVRGHQGVEGNEEADRLARKGALLYKASV